jgi:hypothetical protein
MDLYTCITDKGDSTHLSQHLSSAPHAALRDHIAALPYDVATGPFDEKLEWLRSISGGIQPIELLPVAGCMNTWLWREGARNTPQYLTYIVKTATGA